ncbi:MAG: hypothetical protein JWO20_806 [Candidatus Angelobacter sp.]|nr:hypothetical protein [Candidatus Angelobacter sp.]
MINQETTSFNPRAGNGSAYDLMNAYGAFQQQPGVPNQSFYQNPLASQQKQAWQQQAWQQQPWQQSYGQQPGFSQQFQQPPQFQSQPYYNQFQQQPYNYGAQQQFTTPWQQGQNFAQTPFAQNVAQNPYAGFAPQQSQLPAITHRAAELKLKIPIHRILGRHPAEVQQYLHQVVLPVLLDALAKRAVANELGLTITTDLRGELVAEIDI